MKKLYQLLLLIALSAPQLACSANIPLYKWLGSKITNNTTVPAQLIINYTPDCSKITSAKEKNDCLTQGYTLTLNIEPTKSIIISDYIGVIDSNKQCIQKQNTFENSIQVSFPAEPGTKTYAPLSVVISKEDLQKTKNYAIRLLSGKELKMTIK